VTLPIETRRLVLRPFREADLDEFVAYRNDPDLARFQSWDGISPQAAMAFLRANSVRCLGTPGQWQQIAIALGPGERLIGDIGLFLREDGRGAELGFTLAGGHQGRGFAAEAVTGLADALFGQSHLESLEAVTDTRNLRAMALLERLGFQVQATAEAIFKGSPCQEHTYTLSRATWMVR
jgi:RimJ/RimL family protein N-acetyltransferase